MNTFKPLSLVFALLFTLASCGGSKSDNPTPASRTVELRTNYSGMEYLGGTVVAFDVTTGRQVLHQYVLPTRNSGATTTANIGTNVTQLGAIKAGTKILVRVEMMDVKSAQDAASLNPRSTAPRPPNVYPTFLDVDIVSDGKVLKTVTLDSQTPTNWQGRTSFYTEYTQDI